MIYFLYLILLSETTIINKVLLVDSHKKSHISVKQCYNFNSTSGVSLRHNHLFAQPMADGETVQDTCLETVIILAFWSGDASDKEIAHFPCEIKYKLLYCVFI